MELKDRIGAILDKTLELAKTFRAEKPYSAEFSQTVIMLGPTLEVATVPMTWATEREKFQKFRILSETAKRSLATAIILIADARSVEEETICEKLGIRPVKEIGLEEFQRQYTKIRTERYDGDARNFPPDWYTDLIMTIAKGPTIPVMFRAAYYTKGDRDSIKWLEPTEKQKSPTQELFNLIPDWWC